MDKYIILRAAAPLVLRKYTTSTPTSVPIAHSEQLSPKIEVESIADHELADLRKDPEVRSVVPTMDIRLIAPVAVTTAEDGGDAWGIAAVKADTSPYTGDGVTVAVLDTGIDANHPAFAGIDLTVNDFTGSGAQDDHGHGTHCAGTIFGRDVNGRRIGIARGVNHALIGKVLSDKGGGSSEMLFQALQWARQEHANIISMSLGFDFPGTVKRKVDEGWPADLATSQALEAYRGNLRMFDALMAVFRAQSAFSSSPIVVAAAGNESQREKDIKYKIAASLPAAAEDVISVAAAYPAGSLYNIANFSNSFPDVTAPGVNIVSSWPGGTLKSLSGTSMACPHTAGIIALWWEKAVKDGVPIIPVAVSGNLTISARKLFDSQFDTSDFGFGMITAPGN